MHNTVLIYSEKSHVLAKLFFFFDQRDQLHPYKLSAAELRVERELGSDGGKSPKAHGAKSIGYR